MAKKQKGKAKQEIKLTPPSDAMDYEAELVDLDDLEPEIRQRVVESRSLPKEAGELWTVEEDLAGKKVKNSRSNV